MAEPPSTAFDLHFSIGKIPVRIHPLFWLIAIGFGAIAVRGAGINMLLGMALWAAAVFVSILVHELGHALMARAFGWPPRIVLYGMGGLAIYSPGRQQTRKSRILIDFAGPGAGFLLGALILGTVLVSGHSVQLPGLPVHIGNGPSFTAGAGRLELFVLFMLYVNIFWGLLNLAPVQPLDGGGIAKAIIEKYRPRDAWSIALKLGIGTAVTLAAVGLFLWQSVFLALMFGMLAYNNWQMLQQVR
nr:site-2 protease family protein [Pseudenhygromyxa sp. WMMC2535]